MSVVGLEVAAAVDLRRLATLCGCTVADLTRGAQTPGDITAVGVLAEPRQEVLFEQNRVATEPEQELGGATVALLSLASRPSVELIAAAMPYHMASMRGTFRVSFSKKEWECGRPRMRTHLRPTLHSNSAVGGGNGHAHRVDIGASQCSRVDNAAPS